MSKKLMTLAALVLVPLAPGLAQETPVSMPASAPAAEASTGEEVPLEQMPVEDLLELIGKAVDEGRLREASLLLGLVTRKDPGNLEAKVFAGVLAEARGDMNTARTLYREVLEVQSGHFRANYNLGKAWVRARFWRQAVGYLEVAARVAPAAEKAAVFTELAKAYQGLNKVDEAIEAAREAVAADPQYFEARQVLVGLHAGLEQYDDALLNAELAVEAANRQTQAEPSSYQALQRLQSAYNLQMQVLRMYHSTLYELGADGQLTDKLLPGREREAAETLGKLIDNMLLQANLNRLMAYHETLQFAAKLVEYAPRDVASLMRYGLLLRNTEHIEPAVNVFQRVLEIEPDHAEAKRQLEELKALLPEQPITETEDQAPTSQPSNP